MLGLAQEAFDRTIDYLKTRVQFGRKIGEFQALQHRAAILFGDIEIARSVVFKAATLHDDGDSRFAAFASLAKARVGEIAKHATAEACHLHGGIGMTDDFDLGFYSSGRGPLRNDWAISRFTWNATPLSRTSSSGSAVNDCRYPAANRGRGLSVRPQFAMA